MLAVGSLLKAIPAGSSKDPNIYKHVTHGSAELLNSSHGSKEQVIQRLREQEKLGAPQAASKVTVSP